MHFQPKTEDQIIRETLLEPGTYDFDVLSAEDKVSKSGNEMIHIKLKVYTPTGGFSYVDDYLLEKLQFKLLHFCDAVGLVREYEAGALTAAQCEGRSGKVRIVIQEQDGFPPKNAVKDYGAGKVVGMGEKAPAAVRTTRPATSSDVPAPAKPVTVSTLEDEPPF